MTTSSSIRGSARTRRGVRVKLGLALLCALAVLVCTVPPNEGIERAISEFVRSCDAITAITGEEATATYDRWAKHSNMWPGDGSGEERRYAYDVQGPLGNLRLWIRVKNRSNNQWVVVEAAGHLPVEVGEAISRCVGRSQSPVGKESETEAGKSGLVDSTNGKGPAR